MNKFTFTQLGSGQIELLNIENRAQIYIEKDHAKYNWLLENKGRVITISDKGRWNSSVDYKGYYGTVDQKTISAQANAAMATKPIQLTKLDDLNIDESLFVPMSTGTIFDKFASSEGGFLPGTNIMAAGAPGIGKTTILLELLAKLHQSGKKALFISAEMNQIDMARYLKRFPHWGQLPILFLGDYTEECPKTVVESVLAQGWDIVLTDSYTEVNDSVKEACNLTRSKVEKWFLDLMDANNKAQNEQKKHTTFVTILQLSKGGTFVGSNKLKHMSTAMMHLDWDGSENSGRRYMEFSKNRGGEVGKKLYFDLEGGCNFDEARYARDLFNDTLVADERKQLANEATAFDRLFGFDTVTDSEEVELLEQE